MYEKKKKKKKKRDTQGTDIGTDDDLFMSS